MRSGNVVGVMQRPDAIRLTLEHKEYSMTVQQTVDLCPSTKAKAIREGDHVWTQSGWAMWSSPDLGVEDVQLKIHRTSWDGSHQCGCVSDKQRSVPRDV